MRKLLLMFSIVSLLTFLSCDNDIGGDLPLLAGRVGGEAWTLKLGKAIRTPFQDELEVSFFSEAELGDDPCAIGNSNNTHLTLTIPNELGNFNLPLNGTSLTFEQAGSTTSFAATAGFIEITQLTGLRGIGYLQATFNEDNTVEGRFQFDVCN